MSTTLQPADASALTEFMPHNEDFKQATTLAQIHGVALLVTGIKRELTFTGQDGKERPQLILTIQLMGRENDEESPEELFVGGRLVAPFNNYFSGKSAPVMGRFYYNPTLADGQKYLGWQFLGVDTVPKDWELSKGEVTAMSADHNALTSKNPAGRPWHQEKGGIIVFERPS